MDYIHVHCARVDPGRVTFVKTRAGSGQEGVKPDPTLIIKFHITNYHIFILKLFSITEILYKERLHLINHAPAVLYVKSAV